MYRIGFIGMGNMGSALLSGMLHSELVTRDEIACRDATDELTNRTAQKLGVHACSSNFELAQNAELIILTIKPQYYAQVITEIADAVGEGQTVLTVAPGKTLEWVKAQFGKDVAIIRCMPNTPALVGEGCTAVCRNGLVGDEMYARVLKLLAGCGQAHSLPEAQFDAFVGLCGSSPAYIYMLIEAMADGAVLQGIARDQAYAFAAQAVLGSAKMVLDTGKHPGALKEAVCSPGGTTIEAVRVLEEEGFRAAAMHAVIAAAEKSKLM